jgi:hypothetical protein
MEARTQTHEPDIVPRLALLSRSTAVAEERPTSARSSVRLAVEFAQFITTVERRRQM